MPTAENVHNYDIGIIIANLCTTYAIVNISQIFAPINYTANGAANAKANTCAKRLSKFIELELGAQFANKKAILAVNVIGCFLFYP